MPRAANCANTNSSSRRFARYPSTSRVTATPAAASTPIPPTTASAHTVVDSSAATDASIEPITDTTNAPAPTTRVRPARAPPPELPQLRTFT